jgi:hypothetical protein
MRSLMLAAVAAMAMLSWSGSAEAAKIKLKPAKCPVAADASFKITGARTDFEGVASEYDWLGKNRPGWRRDEQALIQNGSKLYDLLYISKGRKKQVICFDITSFFGKS